MTRFVLRVRCHGQCSCFRQVIRERRILLEAYLRSLLTTKDSRWRSAFGFGDFLAVPSTSSHTQSSTATSSGLPPAPDPKAFTSPTWLTEHNALQSVIRTVRAALLKRDALTLSQVPDLSGARSANVSAKKLLKELKPRVAGLETGLDHIRGSLGDGERRRREGMVVTLRGEVENLDRMAEAGVRRSDRLGELDGPATRAASGATAAESSARDALLPPPSRVFGQPVASAKPEETAVTRPLDDQQLLQHQTTQMADQDQQLTELSRLLNRQKLMGQEIGREIGEQNELLDSLSGEVDRTGAKMGRAKRQMNR